MSLVGKMKRALRGEVDARTRARETLRRSRVALQQRRERAMLLLVRARGGVRWASAAAIALLAVGALVKFVAAVPLVPL